MPYPAPPGPRIAYDLDGSAVLVQDSVSQVWLDAHPLAVRALNDERGAGIYGDAGRDPHWGLSAVPSVLVIIFPSAIRLRAVLADTQMVTIFSQTIIRRRATVETSVNSTNGSDGDWIDLNVPLVDASVQWNNGGSLPCADAILGTPLTAARMTLNDTYRRADPNFPGSYVEVAGAGTRQVKAVRITRLGTGSTSMDSVNMHVHLYGEPDTEALTERLEFWNPTVDLPIPAGFLDWGDVPLSSSADKSFRVRNMSSLKTANAIVLDFLLAASSTSPAPDGFFLLSADSGETWASTLDIAALAPNSVTGEILVRRTVPLGAQLSNWAPRLSADVGSWS